MQEKIPLVVIVGPTGSGKSDLAQYLVSHCNAVLVNGDARQVYRGMDVLAAVPEQREGAYLYACKEVGASYSFAQYVVDADAAIREIHAARKVPVVVGGTGLYIEALVDRLVPPPAVDPDIRRQVQALDAAQAAEQLRAQDPAAAAVIAMDNPRRVQRALEVLLQTGRSITTYWEKRESPYRTCWVGWACPLDELRARIMMRAYAMWPRGVDEVRALLASGHRLTDPGMDAIGVKEIAAVLADQMTTDAAVHAIITATYQYARRQLTWLRRNPRIVWYTSAEDVCRSLHDFLHKTYSA